MEVDTQIHGDAVLEETFYITSKKNTFYRVKLSEKGLSLQKESNGCTKTETIALADIIGCRCMRSKKRNAGSCVCHPGASRNQLRAVESNENIQPFDELDTSAYLYIYAYPMKKPARVKGTRKRERSTLTLRFRSFDRYEDNFREASRWRLAIKCLIAKLPVPKTLLSPSHGNLDSILSACPGEDRKLLVLLNPKSGPGRARETFQRRIHPILSEAERSYDIHITKYPNYARDFVKSKNIYQWSGLLMVGGDGIVFEVVNGLFERPDWERAVQQLPLGIIPCGSGNGLAKSIAHANQEPFDLNPMLISTLAVVKCRKTPMDLVRVETRNQIMFSFLSVGWGLISDIDIESERLRAIGGQRFTIWSVARLIGLRTYKGKVSYLPCEKLFSKENGNNGSNSFEKERQANATEKIAHSKSYGEDLDRYRSLSESRSFHDAIDNDQLSTGQRRLSGIGGSEEDVIMDNMALETENPSRRRLDSFYSATSRRSTYYSAGGVSSYQSLNDSQGTDLGRGDQGETRIMYGPASTLPALTAALPSSWTQIEGEFIMVHASYQSHLGQDFHFAPRAKLADGIIWLLIIRAGITRGHLLQFLLGLSNGSHLSCPGVEMIPVTAFRIEPAEGFVGILTVDGEAVDYGPLQAEVFPSLANVMST